MGATWARWLLVPVVIAVVAIGVWVTGGLLTNDETLAKGLTLVWFGVAGLAVLVLSLARRSVAAPLLVGYAIAAAGIGGALLYTSTVDRVVDEDVVVAPTTEPSSPTKDEQPATSSAQPNVLVAKGMFVDGEHPTDGVASVIRTNDATLLTLTEFQTDPGPDLRVYFVSPGVEVSDGEDLGALKGNRGDQQYELPTHLAQGNAIDGSVVIWCRAFSVAFGTAELT